MMASRLILSLRRVAVKPRGPWYHTTTSYPGRRGSPEDGTLPFDVPPTLSRPHKHPETPENEEDIELESTPRSHQLLEPSHS